MGFFDSITNFFQPISAPLVKFSTGISGSLLDTMTHSNVPSQVFARPETQQLGQQLFAVGSVAGLAIGGAAVAAPLIAGAGGVSALGGSGLLGTVATQLPSVLSPNSDDQDSYSDYGLNETPQNTDFSDLSFDNTDWSY